MSLESAFHEVGRVITTPFIPILGGISLLGAGILAGAGYLAYRGIKSVTANTRHSISQTLGFA